MLLHFLDGRSSLTVEESSRRVFMRYNVLKVCWRLSGFCCQPAPRLRGRTLAVPLSIPLSNVA